MERILAYVAENNLTRMGFTPFAAGRNKDRFYKNVLLELLGLKSNAPTEITFYHLNGNDFSLFYNLEQY